MELIDKIMAEIENACYDYWEMWAGDMNKITKILEKYLPKEEVAEESETKKIELLQDHIMIDKDIARVLLPVEKKVNEIINTLNTLIK